MVEGNADRPGPDVVLEVATALAERMGGAAPLAMICLDPQVLEYGRELIDKKESGRISLCQTLEDIFQGQGRDCKLRIEAGDGSQPFPMVRLVRDDAGTPEVRPTGVSVWSLRPAKRVWSGLQEKPDQQVQDPPQDTWQSSKKRRMPTVSLTKTDSWSDTWQGSKWSSWEKDSSWDYAYSSSSKWSWGWPAGASSAKASGSALKTTWEETMPSAPPLAVFGGLKLFVVGGVPIVGLGKGAEFDSNAAPLLQVALDDHTKAESLYETCDRMPQARRVAAEAKKQNIISVLAEISFVRARGRQFPLAAGLQGKRSMMLALAIALSGHDARCFQRCELFLRTYGLSEDFRRLLSKSGLQAKPTSSLL